MGLVDGEDRGLLRCHLKRKREECQGKSCGLKSRGLIQSENTQSGFEMFWAVKKKRSKGRRVSRFGSVVLPDLDLVTEEEAASGLITLTGFISDENDTLLSKAVAFNRNNTKLGIVFRSRVSKTKWENQSFLVLDQADSGIRCSGDKAIGWEIELSSSYVGDLKLRNKFENPNNDVSEITSCVSDIREGNKSSTSGETGFDDLDIELGLSLDDLDTDMGLCLDDLDSDLGLCLDDLDSDLGLSLDDLDSDLTTEMGIGLDDHDTELGLNFEVLDNELGISLDDLDTEVRASLDLDAELGMSVDDVDNELGVTIDDLDTELGMCVDDLDTELGMSVDDLDTELGMSVDDLDTELGMSVDAFDTELGVSVHNLGIKLGVCVDDFDTELGELLMTWIGLDDLDVELGIGS